MVERRLLREPSFVYDAFHVSVCAREGIAVEGAFVTTREFDNRARAVDDRFDRIEESIAKSADANAATSQTLALLAQQTADDREERKKRDSRMWALTLAFAAAVLAVAVPFLIHALTTLLDSATISAPF